MRGFNLFVCAFFLLLSLGCRAPDYITSQGVSIYSLVDREIPIEDVEYFFSCFAEEYAANQNMFSEEFIKGYYPGLTMYLREVSEFEKYVPTSRTTGDGYTNFHSLGVFYSGISTFVYQGCLLKLRGYPSEPDEESWLMRNAKYDAEESCYRNYFGWRNQ